MIEQENGLDKLCNLYNKLNDSEKEKVIRLVEGLLNSQNTFNNLKLEPLEEIVDDRFKHLPFINPSGMKISVSEPKEPARKL